MPLTARLKIPLPAEADIPDVPQGWLNAATVLDTLAPIDAGPLSSEPISSGGTPGIKGRLFIVTDQSNSPRLDVDTGTSWFTAGQGLVPALHAATHRYNGTDPLVELKPVTKNAAYNAVVGDMVLMTGTNAVALPSAPAADGAQIAVCALTTGVGVNSTGTDTITNNFTSTGLSILTVRPGSIAFFTYHIGVWYCRSNGTAQWVAIGLGTGVTGGSSYVPGIRMEPSGDVARLCGQVGIGSAIAAGGLLFTVPAGFRPSTLNAYMTLPSSINNNSAYPCTVHPNGNALATNAIAAGEQLTLEGETYSIS